MCYKKSLNLRELENQIQSQNTIMNNLNWDRINPATGSIFINEAMATKTVPAFDKGLTPYTDWK